MSNVSKRNLEQILVSALVSGKIVGSRKGTPKFPSKEQIEQRTESKIKQIIYGQ